MEEYKVPKSFRNPPVEITAGESGHVIKIADLKYGKHAEFMIAISSLFSRIQVMPKTLALFDVVINNLVAKGSSVSEAAATIQGQIEQILKQSTTDEKLNLLSIATDGQITKEIVDDMSMTEVYDLLAWLVDRNLKAEKNFVASLSSILTQKSQ